MVPELMSIETLPLHLRVALASAGVGLVLWCRWELVLAVRALGGEREGGEGGRASGWVLALHCAALR